MDLIPFDNKKVNPLTSSKIRGHKENELTVRYPYIGSESFNRRHKVLRPLSIHVVFLLVINKR